MKKFKPGDQVTDIYDKQQMLVLGMVDGYVICSKMDGKESGAFNFVEDQLVLYKPVDDSGDNINV